MKVNQVISKADKQIRLSKSTRVREEKIDYLYHAVSYLEDALRMLDQSEKKIVKHSKYVRL